MDFREGEESSLMVVDGLEASSSGALSQCRICHEEEELSSTTMESPCDCSGSLKFAHRGCIQRWCDEKGNIICEICLQKFEPGYTLPPKVSQLVDVMVTIRGSLEVPRANYEPQAEDSDDGSDDDIPECSSPGRRGASCYRSVAIVITIMLLFRHLIAVVTEGSDHYAFTLATVFLLRATGIIVPFYIAVRIIAAIQRSQWRQRRRQMRHERNIAISQVEENEELQHQHSVQIHE